MRLQPNSEVDGERTRPGCGFPRPRGKHRTHRNLPNSGVRRARKRLDARRVPQHPRRVCSLISEFGLKPFLLLSGLALLLAVSARADLALNLTPAAQADVGSNEVVFTGTLINTSLTDVLFLNNVQFDFIDEAADYLAADTNAFFANVPGILLPCETYSDVVFGITIAPATPPGQYFGVVTIQGGTNIFAATNLAGPIFEVSLPPAAMGIKLSGANPVLSWPSPPGGFVLQQNADLTTTNWTAITNTPTFTNGQNQIILLPTNGSQFYRLEYP